MSKAEVGFSEFSEKPRRSVKGLLHKATAPPEKKLAPPKGEASFLSNRNCLKNIQQEEYICIANGCQQLKLAICSERVMKIEKDEFFRQISDQLEGLDYWRGVRASIRR